MPTYRSDVVGSLLRPGYLKEARERHAAGAIDAAEFKQVEDRAVNEAIALQIQAGLDVLTDGEMRRYAFFGHLIDAVEGFDRFGGWAIPFRDEQGHELIFKRPVVVSRLKRRRHLCAEEFTYLRARTAHPAKVTFISAQQAAAYYDPEKSKGAYATIDAYLADVVDILRAEVDELIRLGCTYIQVDAPQYAALIDPQIREGYRKRGNDPERLLDRCIELDNAVISDHPGGMRPHAASALARESGGLAPGVTFAIHLCRGNNQSKFYASGGYDPITAVFSRTRFQRFLLEYDDERSGGFESLRFIPAGRVVVLGLITTKVGTSESPDALLRRIDEAARYLPLEQLALSPQCGFASVNTGNLLSWDDQRRKLTLVADVARRVWG